MTFQARFRHTSEGYSMDFHTHDGFELMLIDEGEGQMFIGSRVYSFQPGDLFWINASVLHKIHVPPERTYIRTAVTFPPELVHRWDAHYHDTRSMLHFFYDKTISNRVPLLSESIRERIRRAFEELGHAASRTDMHRELALHLAALQLILLVGQAIRDGESLRQVPEPYKAAAADQLLQKLLGYMEQHIHEELGTERIARHFHMNPSYLSQWFKRKTGVTLSRYTMSRRVALVKNQLRTTNHELSAIASSVGFRDASYLCRVFKSLTGTTPHAYRRSVR